jgi:hypothetical protein
MRPAPSCNRRLCAVLVRYLEAAELGRSPAVDGLAATNPDFAPALREFAEIYERLERLTGPVRQAVQIPTAAASSAPSPRRHGRSPRPTACLARASSRRS